MSNPAAQGWIEASRDLGIRYVHPFTFTTKDGRSVTTTGGWLPDFGSRQGTLLCTRFDPEWMDGLDEPTDYYLSGLNPHHYEPYRREVYMETLNDWGWFGAGAPPTWFTGICYHDTADYAGQFSLRVFGWRLSPRRGSAFVR